MDDEHQFESNPRRSFMSMAAALVAAVVTAVPTGIGALFFLGPALRKKSQDDDGAPFLDVGVTVDALPADGRPMLASVIADQVDAWSGYPSRAVGSVWLRRIDEQVIAFNTVCPHLGCSVEHRDAENDFFCPCHSSTFDIDGTKVNQIPPRNMDALDVKVEAGRVLVRYENYRAGSTEKVPV